MKLNDLAKAAHEMARSKGFWDGESADVSKKLLLIHSEVTEAAEEVRAGRDTRFVYYADGKPEGLLTELADVLIRTLDLMHGIGTNVEAVVQEKMAYNATRGSKHGKRF